MTYQHKPAAEVLTPALAAQRGAELASQLRAANAALREALNESLELQEAMRQLERTQAAIRDAYLARKYETTMYGGPAGLAAAVREMREHEARKRAAA